jgi:hypothetical protein
MNSGVVHFIKSRQLVTNKKQSPVEPNGSLWRSHTLPLEHIVTCQRIARQWLDRHRAIRTCNNVTNVYSSLLGNSSAPMDWQDSYHVTRFISVPRRDRCYATDR